MAKKLIPLRDFFSGEDSTYKPKSKPQKKYVQPQSITDYMKARDRIIFKTADKETKAQILERWTGQTQ